MITDLGFYKILVPFEHNLFNELSNSVEFENITNGRVANQLVNIANGSIPIVRTTSKYSIPAQNFADVHLLIINKINQTIKKNLTEIPIQYFNNALIEIYDLKYSKMNYHSDQNLDLEDNSYIGLFSCYEYPDDISEQNIRKLKIKDKVTNDEFDISLTHNSVILFSTETNMKYQHKIVLDANPKIKKPVIDNRWLGITFRTSKTYIHFKNNFPFFSNGEQLILANEEQEKLFFKHRGEENKSLNYHYPFFNFTISLGDVLYPQNPKNI
ncbi:hypothetical protein SAMN05421780_104262 [Flexibacter flexilis DSM 6793]|uniref:2OG-Fe(II) oxygenase superfamily protein n=2 Tax=Flexibacter flexilis TaxID=998 RepID=A0A1I1I903_9BACT|nr:hypothetical protein SAMN05421780_104262 [Flexibacter flexilis DSM 6793]